MFKKKYERRKKVKENSLSKNLSIFDTSVRKKKKLIRKNEINRFREIQSEIKIDECDGEKS